MPELTQTVGPAVRKFAGCDGLRPLPWGSAGAV